MTRMRHAAEWMRRAIALVLAAFFAACASEIVQSSKRSYGDASWINREGNCWLTLRSENEYYAARGEWDLHVRAALPDGKFPYYSFSLLMESRGGAERFPILEHMHLEVLNAGGSRSDIPVDVVNIGYLGGGPGCLQQVVVECQIGGQGWEPWLDIGEEDSVAISMHMDGVQDRWYSKGREWRRLGQRGSSVGVQPTK